MTTLVPEGFAADEPSKFLNTWLVSGPFEKTQNMSSHSPVVGGGLDGKQWEYFDDRLWNRNYDNYQDLQGYYEVRKGVSTSNKFVYVHIYVYSPSRQKVTFSFGTSGAHRVILNGKATGKASTPKLVHRDMEKQVLALKQGWNSVLLEIYHDHTVDKNGNGVPIAKDAKVSYFGFYGRFTDKDGKAIDNLTYSVTGANKTLTIDTQALSADDVVKSDTLGRGLPTNVLPNGYMDWPYVWNKSLKGNLARHIKADKYQFGASGGTPGYTWKVAKGALPDGLTLAADGTVDGYCQKKGTFNFTLQVTDKKGATATKDLSIVVKERPSRWLELGRISGMTHCTPVYSFWVDENYSVDAWAERAKRQGHAIVFVEALQQNYYWPSKFEDPKHPRNLYLPRDKNGKVPHSLKPHADAVRRHDMKFGIYMATEGGGLLHHSIDVLNQNTAELIRDLDAQYIYFDGPQAMKGANYDVVYSNVRNYGDHILIQSNVWRGHGEYGDADMGTNEAAHIYNHLSPANFNKLIIPEPWKSAHTKNNHTPYYSVRSDARQIVKEMIMNSGRGAVDNVDQMHLMSRGPNWNSPQDIATRYPKSIQEFIDLRENTGDWWAPEGKPNRHEAIIGTMPYFLAGHGFEDDGKGNRHAFQHGKGPKWGYATARDNNIYLNILKGPDKKPGYQGEKSLTISPVKDKVETATLLNDNSKVKFTQNGDTVTIDLEGVSIDPVATIIKLTTDNPTREFKLTKVDVEAKQLAPNKLQLVPDSFMTYAALKTPFEAAEYKHENSNPAVATLDSDGTVTAKAAGKTIIKTTATYEGVTKECTLDLIVDADNNIRVNEALVGAVLKLEGKEAYLGATGTEALDFTLEGRSVNGHMVSLHTADIEIKSGLAKPNTKHQPVLIKEMDLFTQADGTLVPREQVDEPTRAAVWAEVKLDGKNYTTNKVFVDLNPVASLLAGATITSNQSEGVAQLTDKVFYPPTLGKTPTWSAPANQDNHITIELKEATQVSTLLLHFNTNEQKFINTPSEMQIQVSKDGKRWETLITETSPKAGASTYFTCSSKSFPVQVKTQFVRLFMPKSDNAGNIDILELEVLRSLTSNIAPMAKVKASSEFDGRYTALKAVDGIIAQNANGEWASKGELKPWIRLEWSSRVTVDKIKLSNRPIASSHITEGNLTFSDGSSIRVKDLKNDGTLKTIKFPKKHITWVKFRATQATGTNNGLSEIEVHQAKE